MNAYTIEELSIGMTESFKVVITEDIQTQFMSITGDINPMHLNDTYAVSKGYSKKIVYGMCTASFYSKLVGVYLIGKNCIFQECHISFTKPVYINDILTITGIIKEIDEIKRRITIKAYICNQNHNKVSRANLIVGVMK